jgi:hypothetical protein
MERDPGKRRILEALRATWQAIGSDVLLSGGVDEVEREDVIDCVRGHVADYGEDREAASAYEAMSEAEREAIEREAFPDRIYGR